MSGIFSLDFCGKCIHYLSVLLFYKISGHWVVWWFILVSSTLRIIHFWFIRGFNRKKCCSIPLLYYFILIVSNYFRLLNPVFSKFFPKWESHCFLGINSFFIFFYYIFLFLFFVVSYISSATIIIWFTCPHCLFFVLNRSVYRCAF